MANRSFLGDDLVNQFSDEDAIWGPLLFLRPQRHQRFGVGRVLAIATLLGGFYGMVGNVLFALASRGSTAPTIPLLALPLILIAVYFSCAQLSIAPAWNRRARVLVRQPGWAEATRERRGRQSRR